MDHYAFVEKAFTATFTEELLPGIFHNFANPLNGIMGRAKLMQRRFHNFVKHIEKRYPGIEQELGAEYMKLLSDIDSINNETDRFFNMFCVSTAKFYAIGTQAIEKLNISSLIEGELAFADFYLDFKHHIRKEIHLDREVPDIEGSTACYSMAFWQLIHQAMKKIRATNHEDFSITSEYDEQDVIVKMTYIDDKGLVKDHLPMIQDVRAERELSGETMGEEENLIRALSLLHQCHEGIKISYEREIEMLIIKFPYQRAQRRRDT